MERQSYRLRVKRNLQTWENIDLWKIIGEVEETKERPSWNIRCWKETSSIVKINW
jgi:hypothetical protein